MQVVGRSSRGCGLVVMVEGRQFWPADARLEWPLLITYAGLRDSSANEIRTSADLNTDTFQGSAGLPNSMRECPAVGYHNTETGSSRHAIAFHITLCAHNRGLAQQQCAVILHSRAAAGDQTRCLIGRTVRVCAWDCIGYLDWFQRNTSMPCWTWPPLGEVFNPGTLPGEG